VAHDRDGVAALALVFLGEEGAAAGGFDAQDVEVAGAGDLDVDLFRGAVDASTSMVAGSGSRAVMSRTVVFCLTPVKMVVLAPMPRARESTATAVKPGLLTRRRRA
jgi:hypothetical protein